MTTQARALARQIVAEVFDRSAATPTREPFVSSEAQRAGRRIVAEILAERALEPPAREPTPVATDEPGGVDVAARLVAEVLGRAPVAAAPLPPPDPDDRVGEPEPPPEPSSDPSVTGHLEEDAPARPGRWILVTIAAAIALTVLFPLAIRALLQLLSLS